MIVTILIIYYLLAFVYKVDKNFLYTVMLFTSAMALIPIFLYGIYGLSSGDLNFGTLSLILLI
jgi:hypothetical protein